MRERGPTTLSRSFSRCAAASLQQQKRHPVDRAKGGVYAAAITPVAADGSPDMDALVAHCLSLLASGCDGVAPLGTTGEAAALPFSFRIRTPEVLAKSGLANDAVLLGVGSPSIGDAISVGRAAVAN